MPHEASADRERRLARLRAARDAPLQGVRATADRLHAAAIHLLRYLRREDAVLEAPVGPAGLSVLSILVSSGPRTVTDLARLERVRQPTMSRLIRTLERYGMVLREPHATDRRAALVQATSVGRAVMRHGRERRVGTLADLLEILTPPEREALDRAAELIERLLREGARK